MMEYMLYRASIVCFLPNIDITIVFSNFPFIKSWFSNLYALLTFTTYSTNIYGLDQIDKDLVSSKIYMLGAICI